MTWIASPSLIPPPNMGTQSQLTGEALSKVIRTVAELVKRGQLPEFTAHEYSVMWLSYRLAKESGALATDGHAALSAQQVLFAGLLHDVGERFLSQDMLNKPSSLDVPEVQQVCKHPQMGHQYLSTLGVPQLDEQVLAGILYHHERYDGTGYPFGLSRERIPLLARLISVADVYSALIHERPYRSAWSRDDALAYIQRESGRSFDPELVQHFIRLVS